MFEKIETKLSNWVHSNNPWTNVYGLARSIIALSSVLTLSLNKAETLFLPTSDSASYPSCIGLGKISLFCLVPDEYIYLDVVRIIIVFLLIVIASGWRPRFTGIIHWYISFSFVQSAVTVDGGDSVAAVITLLLIPLTLTDPRKWHWCTMKESDKFEGRKLIALITLITIRVQIAIIYFHATVAKLAEVEWINGTAVWYYAQHPMLGLNLSLFDIFENFLSSEFVVLPTWGTLLLQTILFAGIFAPKEKRHILLILAIFMHEIFAVFLGLISFSLMMIAALILYFRPTDDVFEFTNLFDLKEVKKVFILRRNKKSA